jgi:hypothetical protein
MLLLQTAPNAPADPGLGDEFTNHWVLPYNRTSRCRVNGLGDDGLGFLNTSDPQADGGGYLGAAVLALKTVGQTNVQVTWRGGTVTPNSRFYAIRLQGRVGAANPFIDLLDSLGQPVEYRRSAVAGHTAVIGPTPLPAALLNQPYVQLRWKYYWMTGLDGPRDQLRVDDVMVTSSPVPAPAVSGVELVSSAGIRLRFSGVPALVYTLEASVNLTDWEPLALLVAGSDGRFEFATSGAGAEPARFYRLRWP